MAPTQLLLDLGYQAYFCKIASPFMESIPNPVHIPPAQHHKIKTKGYWAKEIDLYKFKFFNFTCIQVVAHHAAEWSQVWLAYQQRVSPNTISDETIWASVKSISCMLQIVYKYILIEYSKYLQKFTVSAKQGSLHHRN